jgi:hypothetical protein
MEIELEQPAPVAGSRPRTVALLGVASVLLLVASLRWAHHWGLLTDTLVVAWATATLGALIGSVRLMRSDMRGRLVTFAFVLANISILALIAAGIAYAAGGDPVGACGGG